MTETLSKLTAVPLLHVWEGALPTEPGLFTLGDGQTIPGAWEPRPDQYDAKAIPTPFARAEAMRLILQHLDDVGAHPMAMKFRYLLLGLAAGVLRLEPDTLAHAKYDNLGRALCQVDSDARYFCHAQWASEGRTRSYGLTYRSSLFSPHARRTAEEWSELAEAVRPREKRAIEILLEWREALRRANRWAPTLRDCAWQRGVDHILEGHTIDPASPLDLLREHTRFVGPVWLCLPTGEADPAVHQGPLYLPSYTEGFARRFAESCRFRPRMVTEQSAIVFSDGGNQEVARVRMPSVGTDAQAIALGMGLLELHRVPTTPSAAVEDWVRGRGAEPRLIDLLKPVELALQKLGRPVDAAAVAKCPPLYPDPIRLLFDRNLWPAASGVRTAESRALTDARIRWGGHALDASGLERAGGEQVPLGTNGARVELTMVDRVGETQVNDLRALGYVLWAIFTREAEVSSELGGQIAIADTLEKLLEHTGDRPLEPTRRVYERVEAAPNDAWRRRLATMQRFRKAYSSNTPGLPRLLHHAARSFAAWASGRSEPVDSRLGRAPAAPLTYRLPTGEDLTLALDALET